MISKKRITTAFNRAAISYDTNASMQQTVGARLLNLVHQHVHTPMRVLDLGCGTGFITEKLTALYPTAAITAIDNAQTSLTLATARLKPYPITIRHADFDDLPTNTAPYDLLFSNMALHWSAHFELILPKLITHLNKDGVLAFTIPLTNTLHEMQPYFKHNNFPNISDLTNLFNQIGIQSIANITETLTHTFPNTISALRSLKHVGAHTTHTRPRNQLCGKSILSQANITTLSYHIGYFIICKGQRDVT